MDRAGPFGFLVQPAIAGSLVEACYRFARHAPGVHAVLTGTGRQAHLEQNQRFINGPPLPPGALARLRQAFAGVRSQTGD